MIDPSVTASASATFAAVLHRADYFALARRRWWLAVLCAPALISFSVGVAVFDQRLTLLAVIGLFATYALISVARRSRKAARRVEVSLAGGELSMGKTVHGRPAAILVRRDYVRVLFKDAWIHRMWLDARRDPGAFVDLPLSRERQRALAEVAASAGIPVADESVLGRMVKLLFAGALGFAGVVLIKLALGMSAVTLAAWIASVGAPELILVACLVAAAFVATRRA